MAAPDASNVTTEAITYQSGMTPSTLESAKFWADIAAVGLAVLTAVAGVLALYFSTLLSAAKDAELARFRDESRVAISSADARSAEANQKAAEANKLAESFRLDIAKANERAASANETAEKERLARLQLEARLADRILSPTQQGAIASALKPFGPFSVQIFTYGDITEVSRFADNVAATLIAAGWTVASATASGGVAVKGMVLAVGKTAPPLVKNAATRLVAELFKNGIGASVSTTPMEDIPGPGMSFGTTHPSPQIRILIGSK